MLLTSIPLKPEERRHVEQERKHDNASAYPEQPREKSDGRADQCQKGHKGCVHLFHHEDPLWSFFIFFEQIADMGRQDMLFLQGHNELVLSDLRHEYQ